jgi:hypothetical protein
MSQVCQSMVQSPQSVGTTLEDNLKRKIIFCSLLSFSVTVATPRAL